LAYLLWVVPLVAAWPPAINTPTQAM